MRAVPAPASTPVIGGVNGRFGHTVMVVDVRRGSQQQKRRDGQLRTAAPVAFIKIKPRHGQRCPSIFHNRSQRRISPDHG